MVPYTELLAELSTLPREDAEYLGCIDEIEHAQPEYWEKRLTRQTNLQLMAGNVGWAQLDAMRQFGLLDGMVEAREREIEAHVEAELTP